MLFCCLWYIVGIHLYLSCRDLKDGTMIDSFLDDKLVINGKTVSAENFLNECRDNSPIFKSVGGETVFNLTEKFDFKSVSQSSVR